MQISARQSCAWCGTVASGRSDRHRLDLSLILRHGFRLRKSMKENLSHGGYAPEVHARV
jgi:hypothetical protein